MRQLVSAEAERGEEYILCDLYVRESSGHRLKYRSSAGEGPSGKPDQFCATMSDAKLQGRLPPRLRSQGIRVVLGFLPGPRDFTFIRRKRRRFISERVWFSIHYGLKATQPSQADMRSVDGKSEYVPSSGIWLFGVLSLPVPA